MVDVHLLFSISPERLRNAAEGKTFDEFYDYLRGTGTFGIVDYMTEREKRELYALSTSTADEK